jgi:hypothetical protein
MHQKSRYFLFRWNGIGAVKSGNGVQAPANGKAERFIRTLLEEWA